MIGRIKEIETLSNACNSKQSELVAVYGRRRIGKTYLINYMFQEHRKECIFFRFTGSYKLDTATQRDNFIESIFDWFSEEPTREITTWMQAFNFLKRIIKKYSDRNQKTVIFLDEIPWIDKKNTSGFIGALGHFWNEYCEEAKNIILIICGSNSSWIKNKVFEDTEGPLYQRLTHKIPLNPFTLKETKEYLLQEKGFLIDDKTVTEIYMIFGGVAKYLSFLDTKLRIDQNIDKLYFSANGHLYKEFNDVFKSLFQEKATFYVDVINTLAKKQSGFTQKELSDELGITSGKKLKDAIEDLQECGLIIGLCKFDSKINVKYIICDSFLLFHIKWVSKYNKNEIMNINLPYWTNIASSQQYSIWSGFAFETVCLTNIDLYLEARKTKGLAKSYSYWNYTPGENKKDEKGAQIDILIEYSNNVYDLVECKYYNDEFEITKSYKENILNKIKMFQKYGVKGKHQLQFVMLTSYGTKDNIHYKALNIAADIKIKELLK